jgi:hypothetical protein
MVMVSPFVVCCGAIKGYCGAAMLTDSEKYWSISEMVSFYRSWAGVSGENWWVFHLRLPEARG